MAQAISDEVIEELLQGNSSPQDLLGEEGLFKELKKRLLGGPGAFGMRDPNASGVPARA